MSDTVLYERDRALALITLHQLAHAHNINLTGGSPMLIGLEGLRSAGSHNAS